MQVRFLFILLLSMLFHFSYAADPATPSFDCQKATTSVEKLICSKPYLAKLDKQLSDAYFNLKNNPQGKLTVSVEQFIQDQKTWLKNRDKDDSNDSVDKNSSCDAGCLQTKYTARLNELTFPGAPEHLDAAKVKELISYFSNKGCEDITPLTESKFLETKGLAEFSCKVYEVAPDLGDKLFANCYGSNRDNFTPMCRSETLSKNVDGLDAYTKLLRSLNQVSTEIGCSGTMLYGQARTENSAVLRAMYDANASGGSESASLAHFALKGVWEKDKYQEYQTLRQAAQQGLEKYYIQTKHISADQAKKAAAANVANLAKVYIDDHTGSRDSWGFNQINAFLKNGTLPNDDDYQYETILNMGFDKVSKEQAQPEILAYFLKLAIVNNYSKSDIEKILAAGPNLKNPKLSDNALMNSVKRVDILKLLIDKGADVNAQNTFGKTPLMYAIQFGNLDAVKLLVENKANVNLATFDKKKSEGNCDIAIEVFSRTPLMYAAWHANDDVVKYLLSKGANAAAKDSEGNDYKFYLKKNDYKK